MILAALAILLVIINKSSSSKMKTLLLIMCFLSYLFSQQEWYNHPELDWEIIETEHFIIYYHKETIRSANEAAIVCESVYSPSVKLTEIIIFPYQS